MSNEVRTSHLIEEISSRCGVRKEKVAEIYDTLVSLVKEYGTQEKTVILKGLVRIYPYRTKPKPFYNCKKKQMEMTSERLVYKARMSDSFNRKMWNNEEVADKDSEDPS